MQFDEPKVIEALKTGWSWILPPISRVLAVNSMGNVFLSDNDQRYWRVCPEELSANLVAKTAEELEPFYADPDYKADWQMTAVVEEQAELHGELETGECFGLIVPAALGGEYSPSNIRRRCLYEYLRYTGDVAEQIKDLKDCEAVLIDFGD